MLNMLTKAYENWVMGCVASVFSLVISLIILVIAFAFPSLESSFGADLWLIELILLAFPLFFLILSIRLAYASYLGFKDSEKYRL